MDYLDPKKESRQRIILLVGYVLVAIAIVIGTLVLLYEAYGFGLGKNGTVIQNGLVYFSSQPNPAQIYINGKLKDTTNTRLMLPEGIYHVQLARTGYRDWQRTIEIEGGDVQHFDYPLLIPTKLTTTKLHTYPAAPGLMTQSPDRRWLLVEAPGSATDFDLYDLKNPTKPPTALALPAGLVSKATTSESWQLEEWADDDQHVVLQHNYDGKTEYILVDRTDPAKTVNLTSTLSLGPATKLTLDNKKYDQYYLYDPAADTLQTATLQNPAPAPVLQRVLAYQTYGNNEVLYATDTGAAPGQVVVDLTDGSHTYKIHSFPAGTTYLLDLTEYSGTLYVVTGASSQNKVYIYPNPIGQLNAEPQHAVTPIQVLHLDAPTYVSFSDTAQFVMAEGANQFGVYDIENSKGYKYTATQPIDPPQPNATWMDGDRLTYVSGGRLLVFDYDHANQQSLMKAGSSYLPAFAPDYKNVYTLAPDAAGQFELQQTSLLTPADR